MGDRDYYEVLGVPADADHNTIDKAYWSLARETLTLLDKRPAALRELNEAYEVLSIPDLRERYDAARHAPSAETVVVGQGSDLPRPRGWAQRLSWGRPSAEEEGAARASLVGRLEQEVRAERERMRATLSADVARHRDGVESSPMKRVFGRLREP